MNQKLREFVDSYKKKPMPPMTVEEFIMAELKMKTQSDVVKHNNHEIWRICENCKQATDVRKSIYCENCGEILKI